MRFEIFLAIRYLRTPRRHALAQFTALAAIVGIAFGVAAMILAQAIANGFRQAMQNKILENTAHITVLSADGADISDWQNLETQIEQIKNVKNVSATSFDNALLIGQTNSSYAVLRAVQIPDSRFQIPDLDNEQAKIEIGKDLAEKAGLRVGETTEIVSGSGNLGETFAPIKTTVNVSGIFTTGFYEYDASWIRVDLATAAKLTGKTDISVTALEIKTDDIFDSKRTAKQIQNKIGAAFKVLDWQEANQQLFAALSLERRAAVLIVSLIVFISALNITTTLALVVNERKPDIAIFKTCGARAQSIIFIFLLEGALLGLIGILLGALLGLIICAASNYFGWINLPSDVYSVSEIILEPKTSEILLTIAAIFLLCLTASAFPAWTAAKVKPMENLK
ncbi:MAG: ABC transporter permease [Pyrinomonadaceae bacterium]